MCSSDLEQIGDADLAGDGLEQDPLPFYTTPPLFNFEGELAKDYPLMCTTRRTPAASLGPAGRH